MVLLSIELVLRMYNYSKKILPYDLSNYPYFRKAKNSYGRDSYFIERIGLKNTPKIKTYSEGIRDDIAKEKKDIVLALGCSCTEGVAFQPKETYPGFLQQMLPDKYKVVNAGIGGYGPFQIDKMLQDLIKYKPKIVIVQFIDFMRVPVDKKKIKEGKKYLLFYRQIKGISLLFSYLLRLKSRKFFSIRTFYMNRKLPKEQLWQVNQKYLDSMKRVCGENKTKLVFFIWPSNDSNWLHNAYFQDKLKEYSKTNKVSYFDARNIYQYYREEELKIPYDAHPSALANKLVAKAAHNCLVKNKLIVDEYTPQLAVGI